jgi:serine phosphatase RsbU (regulator of sigma subunit)
LLGLDPAGNWTEQTVAVEPEDTLLLYTDGVTDTVGADGRLGERGLRRHLPGRRLQPELLLREIDAALQQFQLGHTRDDIAMLAAQFVSAPNRRQTRD